MIKPWVNYLLLFYCTARFKKSFKFFITMFGFKITKDLKVYIQYGYKVVDHLFIKCLTTEPNLQVDGHTWGASTYNNSLRLGYVTSDVTAVSRFHNSFISY